MPTHSNLTPAERERLTYLGGLTDTAALLADLDDARLKIDLLEDKICDLEMESQTQWDRMNGPAQDYYDFFHECFQRLEGHYPCPSVTNEYDKSVIFEVIEKGECLEEENYKLEQKLEQLEYALQCANEEIQHLARQLLRYEG